MYSRSKDAAKILGLHPNTLRKLANEGKIHHIKTESGQRRYDVASFIGGSTPVSIVCYCRVSSQKQRDDLERESAYLAENYPGAEIVKDIGKGVNFNNKVLGRAMRGDKLKVVVTHRDRLAQSGFDLVKFVVEQNGGTILVHEELALPPL